MAEDSALPESNASYDTPGVCETSKSDMKQGFTVEPAISERFNPDNDQEIEAPVDGGFLGRPNGYER